MQVLTPEIQKYQRHLAYGRGLSELGNAFRYVSLALAILSVRNKVQDLLIAETLETLGLIAAGIFTPFFIDRVDRVKSLLIADTLSLIVSVLLIAGAAFKSLPLLYVGSFMIMAVSTYYGAALRAVTADLSGNTHASILAGFSLIQLCNIVGALIGSLFAAKLLLYLSVPWLLTLDAITFLFSSVWIFYILKKLSCLGFRLNHLHVNQAKVTLGQYVREKCQEWYEGYRAVGKGSRAGVLCLAQSFIGIGYGIYTPIIVSHYKKNLHFSDSLVALSQANNRAWALLGAILRMKHLYSSKTTLLFSTVVLAFGYALAIFFENIWVFATIGAANFAMALGAPTNNAAVAVSVAARVRGRVEAFRSLMIDFGILAGNLMALVWGYFFNIKYLFPIAGIFCIVSLWIYVRINEWPDKNIQK